MYIHAIVNWGSKCCATTQYNKTKLRATVREKEKKDKKAVLLYQYGIFEKNVIGEFIRALHRGQYMCST